MSDNIYLGLAITLVPFSLLSIGGGASIISGMEAEIVGRLGWLNSRQFIDLFAISRAAPGPGTMLATLIGWKLAGWLGALVATLALFVPSSILCYGAFRLSNAHRERRWHRAMRQGLAPIGTGLIIAGVISIAQLSGGGSWAVALAAATFGVLLLIPQFPVTVLLAVGATGTLLVRSWVSFGPL